MAYTPEFDLRDDQFRNYIINGDMRIAQRGKTFSAITSGQYSIDRWCYGKAGTAVHTVAQDTDVPSMASAGYYFQNSLHVNLTTPSTSLAATDYYCIYQRIEGYNFANLAQKPFVVSFWVKATTPGTYSVCLSNSGRDRTIVKEYTINSASTWEKKTIQVLATPSDGTWNYVNGLGLEIDFTIAAGSNYQTTANAWQSGNYLRSTNQINGVNTGSTSFKITGVMINEGYEALPFKTAGVNYTHELTLCQRYYEKSYSVDDIPMSLLWHGAEGSIGRQYRPTVHFKVPKRTNQPTISIYTPNTGAKDKVYSSGTLVAVTIAEYNDKSYCLNGPVTASTDNDVRWQWTAESEI